MTIVAYRRLIQGLGLLAVLAAGWGVASWVGHSRAMDEVWEPPETFDLPAVPPSKPPRIEATYMVLGSPFQTKEDPPPPPAGDEDRWFTELRKLGRIKAALVVYPPYEHINPALVFEFKDGAIKTIRLGESLIEVKQEGMGELKKPFRFKFIRVERDPKDKDSALFVFDVDCDGKNIQKLRWSGDEKPAEPVKKTASATQVVVLFEKTDKGVITPTAAGRAHIQKHWRTFVKEVRTQPHIDKRSSRHAGVRILAMKQGSAVKQFGVLPDDVVVAINGRPVSHKAEAIKVIREEMGKHVNQIVVELLRQGRVVKRTYDPRDPETRAKAAAALRGR